LGNYYVTDSAVHQVKKIDANAIVTVYAGNGIGTFRDGFTGPLKINASFYNPQGIAIDSNGNLYVADTNNQRVRKISNL